MTTNSQRITAMDSVRKRQVRQAHMPWQLRDVEEPETHFIARLLVIAGAIVLAAVIAFQIFKAFAVRERDDAFTQETVAECKAMGMVPTVERDEAGKAIAVRCNNRRDVIRP